MIEQLRQLVVVIVSYKTSAVTTPLQSAVPRECASIGEAPNCLLELFITSSFPLCILPTQSFGSPV